MSKQIAKFIRISLPLVGAAVLAQTAAAGNASGGVQQQMREVLTGLSLTYSPPPPRAEWRSDEAAERNLDVQEYMKHVLLGATARPVHSVGAAGVSQQEKTVARAPGARRAFDADTQARVQRFLVGEHSAIAPGA